MGFQPAFANIVGFPPLQRYGFPVFANVVGFPSLETLWFLVLGNVMDSVLVSSFLFIVIVIALRPGGATSPQPRATPWVLCNYELFALYGQL